MAASQSKDQSREGVMHGNISLRFKCWEVQDDSSHACALLANHCLMTTNHALLLCTLQSPSQRKPALLSLSCQLRQWDEVTCSRALDRSVAEPRASMQWSTHTAFWSSSCCLVPVLPLPCISAHVASPDCRNLRLQPADPCQSFPDSFPQAMGLLLVSSFVSALLLLKPTFFFLLS